MESLTAVVAETTYRNPDNGYSVLRVGTGREQETVVGMLPELSPGENVTFEGDWTEHPVYGRQFKAATCAITAPQGKTAIEKYLGSGLIRGLGPVTAKLIVRHFGEDTLRVMDENPERLTEISGIGQKRAAMIIESYVQQMGMRRVLVFLQEYGITPALALKIAKYYGETAVEVIRKNPYRLVRDIDGVGFLTADRIALSIGLDPHSEFRIQAALYFLMNESAGSGGHTYLPKEMLLERACEMLKAELALVERELTTMLLQKQLIGIRTKECEEGICLPGYFFAEGEIAFRLKQMIQSRPCTTVTDAEHRIAEYEDKEGVRFSDRQKTAIRMAAEAGVLVITGGPGTGKTTIIRCIIHLLRASGLEDDEILLCAPTGRAAKRMSEATGGEAKTIHRLLEYGGDDDTFARCEDYPLEAACVIVDEMSMVDVRLMRSLLQAVVPGTRLVLVGDSDQLPSVGAGNVLSDILASGAVPSVRLTDIFRQDESSMIVLNAHRINHGELPILRSRNTDFFFDKRVMQTAAATAVSELMVSRLPAYLNLKAGENLRRDIIRTIQVLTPTKKGDCGVFALNRLLQNAINPQKPGMECIIHGDTEFRPGDKVIQIKNDYQMEYRQQTLFGTEEGVGVFNGDVGYITRLDAAEHMLTVCYDDDRYVTYQKQQLDELELAYCLTVHKSQGSEFPVVILPVVGGPPMLMARNLLYTALTRARRLVVLVGREEVIRQMVENDHVVKRYTTLCERLMAGEEARA